MKKIVCKWCGKEKTVEGKGCCRSIFCSRQCREEWHSFIDNRSPFYNENRTKESILQDKTLYVQCKICGKLARRRLSTHIKKAHGMKWKEYIKLYPGEKNECEEIRKFAYDYMKVEGRIVKRDASLKSWDSIRTRKKIESGKKCQLCGFDKYQESLTGHHIFPKQYGGKDNYDNCIIVCENCHRHLHKIFDDLLKKKIAIEDIVRTYVKA